MNIRRSHFKPASRYASHAAGFLLISSLVACGGGTVYHEPMEGPLSIAAAVGNYSTGCVMRAGAGSEYKVVSGTFTDAGAGVGQAVVHYRTYGTDAACNPGSLRFDVSATLDVRPTQETKAFKGATVEHPYVGTADVVQATLRGLTLSKGSFTGRLPTFGASS